MLNIGEFARLGQVSPRMLRHYDELGLLEPAVVDDKTGYRFYEVAQLGRLHRLLALRALGFGLEQLRPLLDGEPPVEELRGMLRLRQAQIAQDVAEDQARLRRVDAHLRALEGSVAMSSLDVAVKSTEAVRIAEAVGEAPGFGHDNLGPVFGQLVPLVLGHLGAAGVRPGIMIAWYEEPADDGRVVLHAGFDVGDQNVPGSDGSDGDGVRVVELPSITVASVVHRGDMEGIEQVYEALVRWTCDSGYELAGRSRELYHEWNDQHPERSVTELQMPVRRASVHP
ncbi:MAG TPA: MerR family transcriptional regulator [Acidimicrobiales bacterium]|nr:MerR family transcriptional regulator [Acidimicrobiales bacterium]